MSGTLQKFREDWADQTGWEKLAYVLLIFLVLVWAISLVAGLSIGLWAKYHGVSAPDIVDHLFFTWGVCSIILLLMAMSQA